MTRRTRSGRALASPLSPEVEWYLTSRGYGLPRCIPRIRTSEPRDVPGAMFNPDEVDRKIAALRHLRHTKGRWAGRPLVPTSEQVAYILAPVFGWQRVNTDGRLVRIIRNLYVEMPRKGAKTTIGSGIAFLLAFADDEPGAEVLLGAASRDQAGAAFKPLAALVKGSSFLQLEGIRALRSEIVQDVTGSVVKVVSSRGDLAHGANVHGGLVDELHVHKDPSLLEAIESGTGAREQPLVAIITTADDGQTVSVYAQRRDMIEKIAKGALKAPGTYGVVFAADDRDDPFAEATWAKANPLYPVTPSKEFLEDAADKARANPTALASFLRLHLGIRSRIASGFIDLAKWDLNRTIVDEADLRGRLTFGGLDLAAVSDITALGWVFPDDTGGYDLLMRFWLPEDALHELDKRTANSASGWVKNGWLTLTPGDVTDYEFVKKVILADAAAFNVAGLGFDPWNSSQLVNDLMAEGLPLEKVRQGAISLSAPLKEIDRLVRLGARPKQKPMWRHGGNPVLRWMADNVRVRMDANGNIAPDKAKSMEKIDGISALATAMAVALAVEAPQESAYETHGVDVI